VTYPVVQTADGNIAGIAVSKAGVTRYAIGAKWCTEEDLKLAAEEKPVTEPVESEPVKLYCVKSYGEWLTKGKIYEFFNNGKIVFDNGWNNKNYNDGETLLHFLERNPAFNKVLFPLIRRPAKVGEWVLIVAVHNPSEHTGYVHNGEIRLIDEAEEGVRSTHAATKKEQRGSWLWEDEYLVLSGYTGDPA